MYQCGFSCPSLYPNTRDRKSTRLNSSHSQISYAVFCLKKKKVERHVCDLDLRSLSMIVETVDDGCADGRGQQLLGNPLVAVGLAHGIRRVAERPRRCLS